MRKLYILGIYLYTLGIRLAALFGHRNARLMVQGWPLTTDHSSRVWHAFTFRRVSDIINYSV